MSQLLSRLRAGLQAPQLRAWSLGSYGIAAPCALLMRRLSTASPPASTQPGVGANPPLPVARWREIEMEHLSGTFLVHNGKEQKKVKVSSKMVGHKFGEFSFTRTKPRGGRSTVEA